MQTPYSRAVADSFQAAASFGTAEATSFELGALRALYRDNGRDREATLATIKEHGYPMPTEVTPEMVALTGAAHACGVAVHLAETRGIEGKDTTYESYTAKNRFDRFTALHLPKSLEAAWDEPLERQPDAGINFGYPDSISLAHVHGIGKPHRYLPAQTARNLEFARLGKLEADTKAVVGIDENTDLSKYAVDWDILTPVIESARDVVSLAGSIGAEIGRQLLKNGLEPEKVAAFLKKSFSIRGMKEEHGDLKEADEVLDSLIDHLINGPQTAKVGTLLRNMFRLDVFLETGESLATPIAMGDNKENPDYFIYPVYKAGRPADDRVLLDIRTISEAVTLVGGNPLHIETLRGSGKVVIIEAASGKRHEKSLTEGVAFEVPVGNTYWYESNGDLVLRDTSENFQLANEPRVETIATGLTRLLG